MNAPIRPLPKEAAPQRTESDARTGPKAAATGFDNLLTSHLDETKDEEKKPEPRKEPSDKAARSLPDAWSPPLLGSSASPVQIPSFSIPLPLSAGPATQAASAKDAPTTAAGRSNSTVNSTVNPTANPSTRPSTASSPGITQILPPLAAAANGWPLLGLRPSSGEIPSRATAPSSSPSLQTAPPNTTPVSPGAASASDPVARPSGQAAAPNETLPNPNAQPAQGLFLATPPVFSTDLTLQATPVKDPPDNPVTILSTASGSPKPDAASILTSILPAPLSSNGPLPTLSTWPTHRPSSTTSTGPSSTPASPAPTPGTPTATQPAVSRDSDPAAASAISPPPAPSSKEGPVGALPTFAADQAGAPNPHKTPDLPPSAAPQQPKTAEIALTPPQTAEKPHGIPDAKQALMLLTSPTRPDQGSEEQLKPLVTPDAPFLIERALSPIATPRPSARNPDLLSDLVADKLAIQPDAFLPNLKMEAAPLASPAPADTHSVNLVDAVRDQVQLLRSSQVGELRVVLRPDAHTELYLQVRHVDGQVHLEARCQRGDFTWLDSQWSAVQNSLRSQGVRVEPLQAADRMMQNNAGLGSGRDDRGSAQREPRAASSLFNEQEIHKPRKSMQRLAASAPRQRGWQSWA